MKTDQARHPCPGWPGPARHIAAAACVVLSAACAEMRPAPERQPQPERLGANMAIASGAASPAAAPSTPTAPATTAVAPPVATPPANERATPAAAGGQRHDQAASPAPNPKAAASHANAASSPTSPVPKPPAPAPAVATPAAAPALDLASLETRLKETHAIGVFTKLALKNQVDDLVGRFRDFYQGRLNTSLIELRHAYDLLVMKVLALLQDADPALARAIAASRESIWGILSSRAKFSAL
jgi:hypothetical protein